MPKDLKRPQPSSSIANALDNALDIDASRAAMGQPSARQVVSTNAAPAATPAGAPTLRLASGGGAAALASPAPAATPAAPPLSTAPTGELPTVKRQFQLTASADQVLKRLIDAYSDATGLDITGSEFFRAMLYGMEHTVELHEREARTLGALRRAKNDPWLLHKRDELEKKLAHAFVAAMRAAPTLE